MGGERGTAGVDGGVVGGNIVGGNPVEVTPMKEAGLFRRGRDDQSGPSWPMSVMPWTRRDLTNCFEGQERMACSQVSGSKLQRRQAVSVSGDLQVG